MTIPGQAGAGGGTVAWRSASITPGCAVTRRQEDSTTTPRRRHAKPVVARSWRVVYAMKVRQVADEVGVSVRTLQRWLQCHDIPGARKGRRGWLLTRASLQQIEAVRDLYEAGHDQSEVDVIIASDSAASTPPISDDATQRDASAPPRDSATPPPRYDDDVIPLAVYMEAQKTARQAIAAAQQAQEEAQRLARQYTSLQLALQTHRRALTENAESISEREAGLRQVTAQLSKSEEERDDLAEQLKEARSLTEWSTQRLSKVPGWVCKLFGVA